MNENKLINYDDIKRVKLYNKPFYIFLTGNVGSGKSTLAYNLSHDLQIYVINNSYNYNNTFFTNNNLNREISKLLSIKDSLLKIRELTKGNVSFIYDFNIANLKELYFIKYLCTKYPYDFINIYIKSKEEICFNRNLKKNKSEFSNLSYLGDNPIIESLSKNDFEKNLLRKKITLEDNDFSYIIDNDNKTLDEYLLEINLLGKDIVRNRIIINNI